MGELRPPSRRQLPVLALDVVYDRRRGPGQQRRQDKADALARAGRGEAHDMLGAVMAQIGVADAAEKDALRLEQAGAGDFLDGRPARRAIGRDQRVLPRAPDRVQDREQRARNAAAGRDRAGLLEHMRRIGVIDVPPFEQPPRQIDGKARHGEPGGTQRRLMAERRRCPLRRAPDRSEHDREHRDDLTDIDACWKHPHPPRASHDANGMMKSEKGPSGNHSVVC